MITSLVVSFLMLVGKLAAFYITGSTAIFSDAAESVIHLLATSFVAFSLWYAVRPPDERHPYGHGKIAYFSAGFEGGLIFLAALMIIHSSMAALIQGPVLHKLGVGLMIIATLGLINLALGLFLVRTGKRHNSLVLVSNGHHVLTDMWTSLGVVAGVALVWLTGIVWLDPVIAILMALNILWTAFKLLRQSVSGLMEKADERDTKMILGALERARLERLISSYHQLRHRRVNDMIWVEYHLLFPETLSITDAHARSHEVEDAVAGLFPTLYVFVTAHLEPEAHDDAHPRGHAEPDDPLGEMDLLRNA